MAQRVGRRTYDGEVVGSIGARAPAQQLWAGYASVSKQYNLVATKRR